MDYNIFSISENALTIDFGTIISVGVNEKVFTLSALIKRKGFAGLLDIVPAYSSLTVFYDLVTVKKNYPQFPTAFSAVRDFVEKSLKDTRKEKLRSKETLMIPVDYGNDSAPDLEFVARWASLSKKEVIKIHTGKIYRVYMIGFLPGFAYMGEIDKRIAAPRKLTPRTHIQKGSVGIAGKQTGVYSLDSPGGWQIIGKTETNLFAPEGSKVSLLETGDLVQFYDINSR